MVVGVSAERLRREAGTWCRAGPCELFYGVRRTGLQEQLVAADPIWVITPQDSVVTSMVMRRAAIPAAELLWTSCVRLFVVQVLVEHSTRAPQLTSFGKARPRRWLAS